MEMQQNREMENRVEKSEEEEEEKENQNNKKECVGRAPSLMDDSQLSLSTTET